MKETTKTPIGKVLASEESDNSVLLRITTRTEFTPHDIFEYTNERLHDQKCAEDDLDNILNEIQKLVADSDVDKVQFQDLYEKAKMYLLIIGLERKSLQGLHSIS